MQFDLQTKQFPRLVGASLFTFLLLCVVALSLLMLMLGLLFQIGAWLSPWLLAEGWNLLRFTFVLLLGFRGCILAFRLIRKLHRRLIKSANYRVLLALVRGTSLYLLRKIIWVLLQ